jgi:uncharacterized protein
MRVAVTGATGLIGSALTSALLERGDQVVALSRDPGAATRVLGDRVEVHSWADPVSSSPPTVALNGADAVVHLLGAPIATRWTEETKRSIRDSRVLSTQSIVTRLRELGDGRPTVLVSQSATGYYGHRHAEPVREDAAAGSDFLAELTTAWEREALGAGELGMRVVRTRTGVVLSAGGGALAKMLPPLRLGLGGPVGGGAQYVPWIHLDDVVGALLLCLDDQAASGPVNVTAPTPVSNAEFSKTLGRVLHRPAVLPVPGIAVRLLYGEMASVVTTGQRAIPDRLEQLGYRFRFPQLEPALRDVLGRG